MPDLNYILLFVAWISSSILLVRTWRGAAERSWRRPALVVLLVTALGTIFARAHAGFVSGGAWLALLFLPAAGMRKAVELASKGKFGQARALLNCLRPLHPAASLLQYQQLISATEAARAHGRPFPAITAQPTIFGRPRAPLSRAVGVLIAVNLAMFAAEVALGGSTSARTLHRLGALEPYAVLVRGEYWRLLTALFLHYGPVHLFVNLFALQFFGPTLERMIGSTRFTASYLICGVASCAEVALLWRLGWSRADQLVGASGAVMGIVGTWAGALLRERHLAESRSALRSIIAILIVQSVFDILTPQVSMAAHLSGFGAGVMVGLLLARRRVGSEAAV